MAGIEQRVLKISILATALIACSAIGVGLCAGSQSIIFDGLFNAIDSGMALLSLSVSKLLVKQPGRRFQQGYWHIEPMALALNGSVLVILCAHAFLTSLDSLMQGGRELAFGTALLYSLAVLVGSGVMLSYIRHMNRNLRSELIQLDIQSWLMSTLISAALLLAFVLGYLLQGTPYASLTPWIDPAILAVLALALIPSPAMTVLKAVKQILRITPSELDREITGLMASFRERYGFERFSHCVAQIGRGLFVEIQIVLPEAMNRWSVAELDQVRAEIAAAIGREGPNRWLAIAFTRDPRWL
ncbi:cation diffusion facilitator family transporter [Metapseudomonas boanensis]|uniref:Cation transporter n=1 Tax=Metapseudomonas boanensis TaxID=2822138 RepID=A0ABS5XI27_9GAMM|nr:cation transporter [Pseudomonas boanensis]MBT8766943.1 cation transporter [Pseudomonas boanensis]